MSMPAVAESLLPRIRRDILTRYRDLADPWYGWVQPTYEANPYRTVLDDLSALGATVEDETDLNDEVSCRYFVRQGGTLVITELSLIGPYAVVWDGGDEKVEPITQESHRPGLQSDVLTIIQAHHISLLDGKVLRTPIDMVFRNVEPGHGTLYQALIADTPGPLANSSS